MDARYGLIARFFNALGDEDIEAVMACLHPEADIPDQVEGGRCVDHDQIRAYVLNAFAMIRTENSIKSVRSLADGNVGATVNHHVTSRDGKLWHDGPVDYRFSFKGGLIHRLDRLEGP
jgi:ketosteroid isomerase-like protein